MHVLREFVQAQLARRDRARSCEAPVFELPLAHAQDFARAEQLDAFAEGAVTGHVFEAEEVDDGAPVERPAFESGDARTQQRSQLAAEHQGVVHHCVVERLETVAISKQPTRLVFGAHHACGKGRADLCQSFVGPLRQVALE